MSLILDALKKSEAERMRGQVPTLLSPLPTTQTHARAREKSKLPLLLLVIALPIIGLILAYFYTQKQIATAPGITPEAVNETPEQAPAIIDPPVIALTAKPAAIQTAAVPLIIATAPAPAAPVTPSIGPEVNEVPLTMTEAMPVARMASLAELPTEQRQQLPILKLSMHVYSPEAGKRFAIIDGQRVNEGSVLGTAVVEQIRQDGVVLSVQGQSYLLPRP